MSVQQNRNSLSYTASVSSACATKSTATQNGGATDTATSLSRVSQRIHTLAHRLERSASNRHSDTLILPPLSKLPSRRTCLIIISLNCFSQPRLSPCPGGGWGVGGGGMHNMFATYMHLCWVCVCVVCQCMCVWGWVGWGVGVGESVCV